MASGVDRILSTLQSRGVKRGIMGASRGWLWIAVASWGIRRIRQSQQPRVVYRDKLKPGQTIQIGHVVVDGGAEPSRRRRRRRSG